MLYQPSLQQSSEKQPWESCATQPGHADTQTLGGKFSYYVGKLCLTQLPAVRSAQLSMTTAYYSMCKSVLGIPRNKVSLLRVSNAIQTNSNLIPVTKPGGIAGKLSEHYYTYVYCKYL